MQTPVENITDLVARSQTTQTHLDYIWVLVCACLVFLMQGGFMCLESGLCRAKNSINVAIKNLGDLLVSVSLFWLFGFGLMFGVSHSGLFGTTDFLADFGDEPWMAIFFLFQAVFCGTAATIDSGAVAERTRFEAYLLISAIVSGLIYPLFGHWAWGSFLHGESQGWLEAMGFIDFAGSTVVHSVGGWVALAGVILIGARLEKFDPQGNPRKIQPHSLLFVYLGTFLLFFGWFGFNCGSTLAANKDIAGIAVNTLLAACFGGVGSSVLSWIAHGGRPAAEDIANGVLAGLVGITAGCASVTTLGAVLIGLTSGLLVFYSARFVERTLRLDDVASAISVHGVCGAWGTMALSFFLRPEAAAEGVSMWQQLGVQSLGAFTCFVWAFGCAFVALSILKQFVPLRVSEKDERLGLNIAEHGATSTVLELAQAMNHATAQGDYSDRSRAPVENGTEIGDLASCYNQMLTAIQQDRNEIEVSRERGHRVASQLSQNLNRLASEGGAAMQDSLTRMQQMKSISRRMNDSLKSVSKISQQTHLLALNASIEAARAGAHGKGFAVVADEVRSLASQSSDAAGEVRNMIQQTTSGIDETYEATDRASRVLSEIIAAGETTAQELTTVS